jgi:hypothetical protein
MKASAILILLVVMASQTFAQGVASNKMADLSLTAVGRQHHPIQTTNKEA